MTKPVTGLKVTAAVRELPLRVNTRSTDNKLPAATGRPKLSIAVSAPVRVTLLSSVTEYGCMVAGSVTVLPLKVIR